MSVTELVPPKGEPALPRAAEGRPHLAYIDGMRAIAALYVMFNHTLFRGDAPESLILRLIAKVKVQGHFAVTAFIVISGFCLMLPVIRNQMALRETTGQFFKRRFWRIAPPMYVACALTLAVLLIPAVIQTYGYPHASWRQIIAHLFLVQVIVPGGLFNNNGVLWSVSVEFIIYLFFPLLIIGFRTVGAAKTTLAFLVFGYAMLVFADVPWLGGMTWQYLGAFAVGAMASIVAYGDAPVFVQLRNRMPWYSITLVTLALVAIPSVVLGWQSMVRYLDYLDLPIAIGAGAALVGASRPGANWVRDLLSVRPLVWIGLFSYSLYLIHFPLADVIYSSLIDRWQLGEWGSFFATVGLVAPLIVFASYLFYVAFEAPCHRLARTIGRSKPAKAST